MMSDLPRVLVIDDLLGRRLPGRRNEERANFCAQFLLRDVTGDESRFGPSEVQVVEPVAAAVFCRGQTPVQASVGDTVENSLAAAVAAVRAGWEPSQGRMWALVLLDLCFNTGRVRDDGRTGEGMPDGQPEDSDPSAYFGLKVLEVLQRDFHDLPIIILSSMPEGDVKLQYARAGARGFIAKDDPSAAELLRTHLQRDGLIPDASGTIIGRSLPLLLALRHARSRAQERRNVLLRGERGVGKELFAHFIHASGSSRADAPFVTVNSATVASSLFASELFGIVKGTATGVAESKGKIRAADGGDLFFDEIADMPADVQAGVLRVLQDRIVTPVGSSKSFPVDVRFITATNVDIEARVAHGEFRPDLVARMTEGGTIYLPPLRDRKYDIPILVQAFLREAEQAVPGARQRVIEPDALELLVTHDWPENVRGLRACIHDAVADYPRIEHVVPHHLRIGHSIHVAPERQSPGARPDTDNATSSARSLSDLVRLLDAFDFDGLPEDQLAGALPALRAACARLVGRYLSVTFATCRRPTDAGLKIHPSMRFASGDAGLTAYQAADLIKRILSSDPASLDLLLEDPFLHEAYGTAVRLRGGKRR